MRQRRTSDGLTVQAIAGTHVVTLGMDLAEHARKGCIGFAIRRTDHTEQETTWLRGMKTFPTVEPNPGPGASVSSRRHPFQAFQWADYSAKPGYDYSYEVIALGRPVADPVELRSVTVRVTTESEDSGTHSVYFNRGSVASQEYARRFLDIKPSKLTGAPQEAAYAWLSRGLLEALIRFIERAKAGDQLSGAFYEFQWPEVLSAIRRASARGVDVHIVYDGIGDTSTCRKNEAAISTAKVKGLCTARTTGSLMHNKFLVLSKKRRPIAVWTGSTNLTENGIFGHSNCGHIVEDAGIAAAYQAYWGELRTNPTRKAETAALEALNPMPPTAWDQDLVAVFSPHDSQAVLDWYARIAASAKGALFMAFAFGMHDLFKNVYRSDDDVLRIALMDKEARRASDSGEIAAIEAIRRRWNVLVAVGNKIETNAFDRWLAEMGGLTSNVQWIHTKFMLVDPLGPTPVVITGSANFSEPSTDANNENMLVIRGDTRVADIYVGEYLRLYAHYAFRESVARSAERGDETWTPQNLVEGVGWQAPHYRRGDRALRRRYFAGT